MTKRHLLASAMAAAVALGSLSLSAPAEARDNRAGAAVAGAVIGLAAGALIGSALSQDAYAGPVAGPRVYHPDVEPVQYVVQRPRRQRYYQDNYDDAYVVRQPRRYRAAPPSYGTWSGGVIDGRGYYPPTTRRALPGGQVYEERNPAFGRRFVPPPPEAYAQPSQR